MGASTLALQVYMVYISTLLFSSLTAHHRAEGNPHTQELTYYRERRELIDYRRWVQYMTETGV